MSCFAFEYENFKSGYPLYYIQVASVRLWVLRRRRQGAGGRRRPPRRRFSWRKPHVFHALGTVGGVAFAGSGGGAGVPRNTSLNDIYIFFTYWCFCLPRRSSLILCFFLLNYVLFFLCVFVLLGLQFVVRLVGGLFKWCIRSAFFFFLLAVVLIWSIDQWWLPLARFLGLGARKTTCCCIKLGLKSVDLWRLGRVSSLYVLSCSVGTVKNFLVDYKRCAVFLPQ